MKDKLFDFVQLLLDKGHYPEIATHDEPLIRRCIEYLDKRGCPKTAYEFQMLLGVPRQQIQTQIVNDGRLMRLYVPFAEEWKYAIAVLQAPNGRQPDDGRLRDEEPVQDLARSKAAETGPGLRRARPERVARASRVFRCSPAGRPSNAAPTGSVYVPGLVGRGPVNRGYSRSDQSQVPPRTAPGDAPGPSARSTARRTRRMSPICRARPGTASPGRDPRRPPPRPWPSCRGWPFRRPPERPCTSAGGFGIGCEKSTWPLSPPATIPCSRTNVHANSLAERDRS